MLTREQRCKIAAWQEVFQSPTEVQRLFHATYGPHYYEPTRRTIYAIHAKFLETGSVNAQPRSGRPRSCRSVENQEVVEATFVQDQTKSIRRASLELNISRTTIHRLLKEDIGMYPCKLQIVQSRAIRLQLKVGNVRDTDSPLRGSSEYPGANVVQ